MQPVDKRGHDVLAKAASLMVGRRGNIDDLVGCAAVAYGAA